MFENYSKCRIWIFDILAFSTIFCPSKVDLSGNTVWPQASGFEKLAKMDSFWHFWLTFVHSKCKRSSQCWMRLFLWFSNTVSSVAKSFSHWKLLFESFQFHCCNKLVTFMHQMHLLFSPFVEIVREIFYMDGKRQSIKLAFGNFYSVFLLLLFCVSSFFQMLRCTKMFKLF